MLYANKYRFFFNLSFFSLLIFLSACMSLPLNERLSYQYEDMAASLRSSKTSTIGQISLKWMPPDFPSRVDVQGASGFVGAASRTSIPTGIALSSRIKNVLDKAIGINPGSSRLLTITIIEATNKFKYGYWSNELTYGECFLNAKFEFNGLTWEEEFIAKNDKSKSGGTYGYRLENTWDEVALQVGKSVIAHLSK